MGRLAISEWCRRFAQEVVKPGDLCVDATAGTGQDTVFLARLVGERGQVLAYDIQEEALRQTGDRLKREGLESRVRLIQKSHVAMEEDARPKTSVLAVDAGLRLLKSGGLMCLCIYSGKDTGYEEKAALLTHLKELDQRQYLVIVSEYYNRKNDPPIPALIYKK